jgi:ArsR family transcriptional regulator, nickel/cobalt-responsive transcriptional repressor
MHPCLCNDVCVGQRHGVTSTTRLTPHAARLIARVMDALGTPSRVLILGRLREGACSVGELCEAVGMTQPAVSQQLRILRDLEFVVGVRRGRQTIYGLYDPHVSVLLDEALRHIDHLRADGPELPTLEVRPRQPEARGVA